MTLNDIIVSALAQLDRGHDAQTLDVWRDKLTRFANDALIDLASAAQPRRTETATIAGGRLDIGALDRPCLKVLFVRKDGKALPFRRGENPGELFVENAADGEIKITYAFAPRELSAATDVPELPLPCHALIVTYVVGRERASGDVSVQRGGNVYFQMYEAGKHMLRPGLGSPDEYKIVNRW